MCNFLTWQSSQCSDLSPSLQGHLSHSSQCWKKTHLVKKEIQRRQSYITEPTDRTCGQDSIYVCTTSISIRNENQIPAVSVVESLAQLVPIAHCVLFQISLTSFCEGLQFSDLALMATFNLSDFISDLPHRIHNMSTQSPCDNHHRRHHRHHRHRHHRHRRHLHIK